MERKNGPWIIKHTIPKYKNAWIEVNEDQVIRPDGKRGIFGTVKMMQGVCVLPLDEEGFVYLTEEFRYTLERESIEAVSGGIETGEQPLDAAKRELKEELGITAKEWIPLGIVNPFTSVIKSPVNLFLVKGLTFTNSNPETTELIKTKKMKLEEAISLVLNSKITHSPTGVLIFKARDHLKNS
ncbi:NUDIX hydrolase [Candidatus Woesearchaeota archaeon]|nr:NUDIX hydrolase [Candidatus Woesearchaeota archaeon]